MGAFNINITGVGGHGCERKAKPGEKLHGRCGRFNCPDCLAYEFVQRLRQAGMVTEGSTIDMKEVAGPEAPLPAGATEIREVAGKFYAVWPQQATFTHWPGSPAQVVDDMLKNERKSGSF
jgi:hypothetical protein